ncbi:MAG: hypothetical protein PHR39_00525 [Actinomycetota bacterium]|nr:hypothetical protein [Actinomycetota bacterium]
MNTKNDMKNLVILFTISDCKNSILFSSLALPPEKILLSFKMVVSAKNEIKKQAKLMKNDIKLLEMTNTNKDTTEKRNTMTIFI